MQTYLQAKRILEGSFLPYHCKCHLENYGEMTISIYEPTHDELILTVPKVPRTDWNTIRGVAALALRLRQDIDLVVELERHGVTAPPVQVPVEIETAEPTPDDPDKSVQG